MGGSFSQCGELGLRAHAVRAFDTHYVFMRRVHSCDKRPHCVISVYLDERMFRKHPKRFCKETVIPILNDMRYPPIDSARQTLTIGTADLEVSKLLKSPLNSPVAEVRRVFTTANVVNPVFASLLRRRVMANGATFESAALPDLEDPDRSEGV